MMLVQAQLGNQIIIFENLELEYHSFYHDE